MIKNTLLMLLLVLVSATAMSQKTVKIKGFVHGDTKGYNKIFLYGQGVEKDSTIIKDSVFEFSIPYEKPAIAAVFSEFDIKTKGGYTPAIIILDQPATITLNDIDIAKGLNSGIIKGTSSAQDFYAFSVKMEEINKAVTKSLEAKYPAVPAFRTKEFQLYRSDYDSVSKIILPAELKKFVPKLSDSYGAAAGLEMFAKQSLSTSDLESIYNLLGNEAKRSKSGTGIAGYLQGQKNSAVGAQASNFSLPSPEDKEIALSSLKGKYVWIDFWASWCKPCIASFPSMKDMYSKYRDKNLEIISVSIDRDKSAWLKGLQEQQLPWLQVLDTKEIAVNGFAVSAVPTGYLLDPAGKIILKEIGFTEGGEMDKKLKELFGN